MSTPTVSRFLIVRRPAGSGEDSSELLLLREEWDGVHVASHVSIPSSPDGTPHRDVIAKGEDMRMECAGLAPSVVTIDEVSGLGSAEAALYRDPAMTTWGQWGLSCPQAIAVDGSPGAAYAAVSVPLLEYLSAWQRLTAMDEVHTASKAGRTVRKALGQARRDFARETRAGAVQLVRASPVAMAAGAGLWWLTVRSPKARPLPGGGASYQHPVYRQ
ncbi:hypothetical protein [Streptomyces sp. CS014]|uniref:hypothetical protein n=1 Tax=Streptomyces sp. CS014 TaxID=2162707 RepID=UPI000D51A104|nr:hypothetical protein [Streptomyces sp. CS014]PVD04460.1 hypothetical protein DBP12_03275 [Streptomyces sp. CS014]